MPEPTTFAVTGASGFIGSGVVARLHRAGGRVVALGRRPVAGTEHRRFALGESSTTALFTGVDVLVHCAWDLAETAPDAVYARNVVGSIDALRTAASAGVRRVVFISSMSAYAGTSQTYGRTKLAVERFVSELGGVSLRLGLVWGDDAGGMVGALQRLIASPVVPVLGSRSYQFTAHVDDVLDAITAAAAAPSPTGVLGVAHPDRVPTRALLSGLATSGASEPGRLVPVPWRPVYLAMRAGEHLRIPLPVRADSLLGLARPAPDVPRVGEWSDVGVALRPFPVGRRASRP